MDIEKNPRERPQDTSADRIETFNRVDLICDAFERAWLNGGRPRLDEYLEMAPAALRDELRRELEAVNAEYERRGVTTPPAPASAIPSELSVDSELPGRIGRYRIDGLIGKGSFGRVFLAQDEQLDRQVAIKTPHTNSFFKPGHASLYLAEARIVASLDHPNIVPVYDAGRTPDIPWYIVSKYVVGADLAARLKSGPMERLRGVELIATVADALHHAHGQGLVHQDVKPGNILLDHDGKAYVADFGLALREQAFDNGPHPCGTPAYMSPEQASGEGHRVDARSDIFSLGVVLYEILVGRRPFRADSTAALLKTIVVCEPERIRQYDPTLPKELERICEKAIARRASDRYPSAGEFALDLKRFLSQSTCPTETVAPAAAAPNGRAPLHVDTRLKVMPKGLRAFDADDADLFLELLPGPRDSSGLPESLCFWKRRIEAADPDKTFSIGLIYGPSGCGKSSFVQAGLLPRLSDKIVSLYIESTADETEESLIHALRSRFPALSPSAGVKTALADIRRGMGMSTGNRLLIILDQFEQWLHANQPGARTELLQALRQCDGERVQCVIMVRDDFWMATTRFMRELEVQVLDGENSAPVDLSTISHAEKVLAAFGRAFGALPDEPGKMTAKHIEFIQQSAAGLADDGKVSCVRLSLFAEIFKDKPWQTATLRALGGAEGVDIAFLDDKLNPRNACFQDSRHRRIARSILTALLPAAGENIRGHVRSHDELLAAARCGPGPFETVIRILDSELRLITPIDRPEPRTPADEGGESKTKYYQLTHDFLVPSLRKWLTRTKLESSRGRAELRLAERAAIYESQPENRHLPALLEVLLIRSLTNRTEWTRPQAVMMDQATAYHSIRVATVACACLLLAATVFAFGNSVSKRQNALHAERLVEGLLAAKIEQAPLLSNKLAKYESWADPLLAQHLASADPDIRLRASLALLPRDASQAAYLMERMLTAQPQATLVLRQHLSPHSKRFVAKLWQILREEKAASQRLRAAAALALYEPTSDGWQSAAPDVAALLSDVNPTHSHTWMVALRPVQDALFSPLVDIFADPTSAETRRALATDILSHYAAEDPAKLAKLCVLAEPHQFDEFFTVLEKHGQAAVESVLLELSAISRDSTSESADKTELASIREANALVTLARLGKASRLWERLRESHPPSTRCWVIHRLASMDASSELLVNRLRIETNTAARRALLLALGEFTSDAFSVESRAHWTPTLLDWYQNDSDPGVHGAVEWLARCWDAEARQTSLSPGRPPAQASLLAQLQTIDETLATGKIEGNRRWYVNGHRQTMIVIDSPPKPFLIGSPETERNRSENEKLHRVSIGHSFALANKEVTVEQYRRFFPDFDHAEMRRSPEPDCPVQAISWYDAARYCNKLSEAEGIPESEWCYLPNQQNEYAEGMRRAPDYLSRSGYRLPTEAEWEYACRAGSTAARYFGDSDQLLSAYAWHFGNANERTWPGGMKKPNEWGLFDMLGNVYDWCSDEYFEDYNRNDQPERVVRDEQIHVLRGGPWNYLPPDFRSAYRNSARAIDRYYLLGIRPARTCVSTPYRSDA